MKEKVSSRKAGPYVQSFSRSQKSVCFIKNLLIYQCFLFKKEGRKEETNSKPLQAKQNIPPLSHIQLQMATFFCSVIVGYLYVPLYCSTEFPWICWGRGYKKALPLFPNLLLAPLRYGSSTGFSSLSLSFLICKTEIAMLPMTFL